MRKWVDQASAVRIHWGSSIAKLKSQGDEISEVQAEAPSLTSA